MLDLMVLGVGFVGEAVLRIARRRGCKTAGFSRTPAAGLVRFDAQLPAAVDALPAARCAVVTFPGAPAHLWTALQQRCEHVILLGTTGVYARAAETVWADSPVKEHPRIAAETSVLAQGGTVLRLAGLYGGARDPLAWVERGKVGNEERIANLVHRDDVAELILAAASHRKPGVYVVSDGEPITWRAMIEFAIRKKILADCPPRRPPSRPSAFVDPSETQAAWPAFQPRKRLVAIAALRSP
jgi:nucleoside-diphosphate-sugar epimerase